MKITYFYQVRSIREEDLEKHYHHIRVQMQMSISETMNMLYYPQLR